MTLQTNYLQTVTTSSPVTENLNFQTTGGTGSCWSYWQDWYYPNTIINSYPVYIREQAQDNGKKAFEILKHLQDKKLMKIEKVADFIEAMDVLIKIL